MKKLTDKEKMKELVQNGVTRFEEIALKIGYPPLRNEKRQDYEEIDPKIKSAQERIKDLFNITTFILPSCPAVYAGMVIGAGCNFLCKKIKERTCCPSTSQSTIHRKCRRNYPSKRP